MGKGSKIEIYTEILLGILRYTRVKNIYEEEKYKLELKKKLKFLNQTDPDLFRACIDLIEDTQYAINEVVEFGLTTKADHQGEMYLRLYGLLNACYLQAGAIIALVRLFNLEKQKEIKNKFDSLKIIEIRNKVGSHTANYLIPNSEKELDFYKVSQSTISKWGNNILIVGKNSSETFDLIPLMKTFTNEIEVVLEKIVKKELYSRVFKKEHLEWLEFRYKSIHN